jgi:hypothetical protein
MVHAWRIALLGNQTGLLRERGIHLLAKDVGIGLGLGRLQAKQHVALGDLLGVLDQDLADDAALEMLHHFMVARYGDLSRRDGGAVERRDRRPDPEAAEHRGDRKIAEQGIAAEIALGRDGAVCRHRGK